MKRPDINYFVYLKYLTNDVRPSVLEKIESSLQKADIWSLRDFCSMSEDKLRKFPYVTDEILNDIKAHLSVYGLKLGMTEDEFAEYQDAEFFETHPRANFISSEKTEDEISIESLRCATVAEDELLKDIINSTDLLHRIAEETLSSPSINSSTTAESVSGDSHFDPIKEMRRAYADCMYDPARNMETDGEWIFHQVRLCMLREQPWFIKWFVPFDIRIKMAFDKADIIMKQYKKNAVERSVVFRRKNFDGSLARMRTGN